ncbi:putative metal homeostasis protein [Levilactobacillus bambusae]|nr:putative metal homeostasis protein [Levilactobacillus bambusae]
MEKMDKASAYRRLKSSNPKTRDRAKKVLDDLKRQAQQTKTR